jgi:hypothetical protein
MNKRAYKKPAKKRTLQEVVQAWYYELEVNILNRINRMPGRCKVVTTAHRGLTQYW